MKLKIKFKIPQVLRLIYFKGALKSSTMVGIFVVISAVIVVSAVLVFVYYAIVTVPAYGEADKSNMFGRQLKKTPAIMMAGAVYKFYK